MERFPKTSRGETNWWPATLSNCRNPFAALRVLMRRDHPRPNAPRRGASPRSLAAWRCAHSHFKQRAERKIGGSVSRQFGTISPRSTEKHASQPRQSMQRETETDAVHALSMEFVAKPNQSHRAQTAVPAAINSTLQGVTGFAGCLVMSSHQEARLMTVITFWKGGDGARHCTQNTRWLCKLLEPYLDGGLKCRTYITHSPAPNTAAERFGAPKAEAAMPLEMKAEELYVA